MKLKQKYFIGIVLLLISIILFGTYLKFHKISKNYSLIDKIAITFFDKNSYGCEFSNIDSKDIKIYWHSESNRIPMLINRNGKFINSIKNNYGKNIFELFYKDEFYFRLTQFKKNRWFIYSYLFKVTKQNDSLKISFQCNGPDSIKFEMAKQLK